MSYQLSRLDLVVNNATTQITVNTSPSTEGYDNGNITPTDNIINIANANNRYTNPDATPAATIKSISTANNLTNLTATEIGTTSVPISGQVSLNNNFTTNYDEGPYTQLLTGIGSSITSTTIEDLSSNKHTLIANNVSVQNESPLANAYKFFSVNTAATQNLSIPYNARAMALNSDFTIEAWVRPTSWQAGTTVANSAVVLSQGGRSTADSNGYTLYIYSSGVTFFSRYSSAVDAQTYNWSVGIILGTWYHLAIVRSGTSIALYVNGLPAGYAPPYTNGAVATPITNSAFPLYIGRDYANSILLGNLIGNISNVRITRSVVYTTGNFQPPLYELEAIQPANPYIGSSSTNAIAPGACVLLTCIYPMGIVDPLEYASDLTVVNNGTTPSTVGPNFFEYKSTYSSYDFKSYGTNSIALSTSQLFAFEDKDFTIEFWWSDTSSGYVNEDIGIVSTMGITNLPGNYPGIQVTRNAVSIGNMASGDYDALTWNLASYGASWVHCAICRIAGVVSLYINGSLVNSATIARTLGSTSLVLGRSYYNWDGLYVKGSMASFRVVSGKGVYTGTFRPINEYTRISSPSTGANIVSLPMYQKSMAFNGTSQYLTVPNNAGFEFGTGDFTIEGWYYFNSFGVDQCLISLGTGAITGTTYTGWWLRYNSSGYLSLYRYDGAQTEYQFVTPGVLTTAKWYHIACTRSGTNLRMFLNGVQVGTTTTSSLNYTSVNSDPLQIGKISTGGGTYYLNGYVSNVRVVKGTAVYTSAFTPSTTPLTKTQLDNYVMPSAAITSGTALLLNGADADNFANDYSGNNLAVTKVSSATYVNFSPFPYVSSLLKVMGNTTNLADYSGYATPITTLTNVIRSTVYPYPSQGLSFSGYTYSSLFFDGTSSYLSISNCLATSLKYEDFTIEFWIKPQTIAAVKTLIDTISGSNKGQWQVVVNATKYIQFIYNNSAGGTSTITATSVLNIDSWNHVAIVRRFVSPSTTFNTTIYINGVAAGTGLVTDSLGIYSNTGINIGRSLGATTYYSGYLSNIRIVGKAVYTGDFSKPIEDFGIIQAASNSTIAAIPAGSKIGTKSIATDKVSLYEPLDIKLYDNLNYNSSFGQTEIYENATLVNSYVAPTANKNIISSRTTMNVAQRPEFYINGSDAPNILGSSSVTNVSATGGAAFNGGKNLVISNSTATWKFGTSDFTIETWFNVSIDGPSGVTSLFQLGASTDISLSSLSLVYQAGNLIFYYGIQGSQTGIVNSMTMSYNSWYHIAIVRRSNIITMYLNGIALPSTVTDTTNYNFATKLTLGALSTNSALASNYLVGYMSNFRIVPSTAVYTGNFTVPTVPLEITQSAGTNITAITGNGTSLLILKGSTLVDNSAYSPWMTITNNGGVTFASGQSSYSLTYGTPIVNTTYISTPSDNPTYIRNITKNNDPRLVGGYFNNFIPAHTGEEDKVQAWI